MKRRIWLWLALVIGVPGCGDTIQAVQRDYYNVEHEIIDNMIQIVDENSAKRFNEVYKGHLSKKEDSNKERFDKIKNNQFTTADQKLLEMELKNLDETTLKVQISSLEYRFRQAQNRIRKLIVRVVEEKAEEMKRQGKSFTVEAKDVCPNLSRELAMPVKFSKNEGGGGGGMPPMMMPMQMPAGAGPQGMPAAGPAGNAGGAPPAAIDPQANKNLNFVITCELINPGQWNVTRRWKSGGTDIVRLEINGFDLAPLTSN
jgi:hypothetical protein